ncbi:hypothetical protein LTR78_007992 [Recurvomyces mirabilis]|uniref:NADP-dependent oxidoreductase domain-containing protein n=1 Tax=Recurvomyces mirabilis TaxID=574656 RepID=A0AAE0TV02_9PEZI|nr:hypothetical protein LTR78_007992 [Recurvomyces mirabilis]KAK5150720.1 hypothetical protein LTS14_009782 [Recurvomyces mirabilis]
MSSVFMNKIAIATRSSNRSRVFGQKARTIMSFTLNTGAKIPAIGFGTFQDPDAQEDAVCQALQKGLRLIDTARVYDVEKQVGRGVKKTGVKREDIFIATKLWCNDYHPETVSRALEDSLSDLDTPYVDLLLMHYPCTFASGADRFPRDASGKMIHGKTDYVDTWRALERLVGEGRVRAIGVSNFSKGEVQRLLDETSVVSHRKIPAVHQMEVHPYLQQQTFSDWHRRLGIHIIQFSPLGNMNDFYRQTGWSKEISHMMRVIDQPVLKSIGEKYGKSPVQVVLAWGVNHGRSVIPKSVVDWQIDENVAADFELEREDMEIISELDAKARCVYRDIQGAVCLLM